MASPAVETADCAAGPVKNRRMQENANRQEIPELCKSCESRLKFANIGSSKVILAVVTFPAETWSVKVHVIAPANAKRGESPFEDAPRHFRRRNGVQSTLPIVRLIKSFTDSFTKRTVLSLRNAYVCVPSLYIV